MNTNNNDMEQFQSHREELLDLMNEAQPLLNDTAAILDEDPAHYELPIERLKKNLFTLTLVGAFQSGKSTLFSYLCGGRELSPIGPGGGGIRTSGCRVTATALGDDGAEEYAVVSWRSKKDLMEPICSLLGVKAEDYDLDDSQSRDDLMTKLVSDMQGMVSMENLELYRIALLVVQFYPDFRMRIMGGDNRIVVDEAICIASYPQDWEQRWMKWTNSKGAAVSSFFDASIVSFVFCSGVQYFIYSKRLESLQCSVVDCPGLFASEWDNKVAEQCVSDSNAILYIFEGLKDLTQNDIEILKKCIELGGRDRIFFGANVKVPYSEWKRIEQLGVLPKLQQHGFENPVIHAYHAALALRSLELSLEQDGMLPESTRDEILRNSDGKSVEDYLKYRLTRFLLNALDQTLDDYTQQGEINTSDIETRASKVPDFILVAQQKIVQDKAWSILVGNGVGKMAVILDTLEKRVSAALKNMDKSCEDIRETLRSQEEALQAFEEDVQHCSETLDAATHDGITRIKERCRAEISNVFEKRKVNIISITEEAIPIFWKCVKEAFPGSWTWTDFIRIGSNFGEAKRVFRQQYLEKLNAGLVEILTEIRDYHVRDKFTQWDEFTGVKTRFDYWKEQMLDKVKKLEGFPELDSYRLHLGEHFGEQELQRMQIKGIKDSITEETLDNELRLFFNWLTSAHEQAKKFVEDHKQDFIRVMEQNFMTMLETEGPIKAIKNYLEEFKDTFKQPRQYFEQLKTATEKTLRATEEQRSAHKAALEPKLTELSALKKKTAEFTEALSNVYKH